MSSAKWQPFYPGGDELIELYIIIFHGQATSPNIMAGNPDDESGTWCVHPELLLCLPGQYTAGTGEWLKWFRRRNKMASNFCKYITKSWPMPWWHLVLSHQCRRKKLSWFFRHLSDILYIFCLDLWNLLSDIWAQSSEMSVALTHPYGHR